MLRSCAGLRSLSVMMKSTSSSCARSAASATFPAPTQVAALGRLSFWTRLSSTSMSAVFESEMISDSGSTEALSLLSRVLMTRAVLFSEVDEVPMVLNPQVRSPLSI